MYEQKAQEMQDSLTEYPWESKEKIFTYWALNDVGTCLFIKGEAYRNAGDAEEAKKAYKKLVDSFYYAQAWDSAGFFWKPAEAAQQKLELLTGVKAELRRSAGSGGSYKVVSLKHGPSATQHGSRVCFLFPVIN